MLTYHLFGVNNTILPKFSMKIYTIPPESFNILAVTLRIVLQNS